MRKILSILFIAICSVCSSLSVSGQQKIPKDVLPEMIKLMKAECPKTIGEAMVWTDCFLRNSNSEIVFTFNFDPAKYGVTSADMIQGFNEMTEKEKSEYMGSEFKDLAKMMPVPIYALFVFPDGQKYNMLLAE